MYVAAACHSIVQSSVRSVSCTYGLASILAEDIKPRALCCRRSSEQPGCHPPQFYWGPQFHWVLSWHGCWAHGIMYVLFQTVSLYQIIQYVSSWFWIFMCFIQIIIFHQIIFKSSQVIMFIMFYQIWSLWFIKIYHVFTKLTLYHFHVCIYA